MKSDQSVMAEGRMKAVGLAAAFAVMMSTACGESSSPPKLRLRIYDPLGQIAAQVTASGVLRKSAVAAPSGDGFGSFYFRLTNRGESEFHRLTRALAKRGARQHQFQEFVVEMNGKVLARPRIDYKVFPDGFDGRTGLEFSGLRPEIAHRLAREMRQG